MHGVIIERVETVRHYDEGEVQKLECMGKNEACVILKTNECVAPRPLLSLSSLLGQRSGKAAVVVVLKITQEVS